MIQTKTIASRLLAACIIILLEIIQIPSRIVLASDQIEKHVYSACVAYIQDANETGTNINDETMNGLSKTIPAKSAEIVEMLNGSISVVIELNGREILVHGIPTGRSESGKTVFFKGETNHPDLKIVNFAYVLDTEKANMYFKKTKENDYPKADTMLKIYIKDNSANTRDFYFIEIFDVKLRYSKDYIQSLNIDPILGAWVTKCFSPINDDFGEDISLPTVMATVSNRYWHCTKEFYEFGETQTHTIRWRTNTDCSDIIAGQQAEEYYRLTIYSKYSTYSINTDLNSNIYSCLHISEISLCQTSIPNTAWKSTMIDGSVQASFWLGDLSADISISLGVLSLTYSIPSSFTHVGTVYINPPYMTYENGVGGNYTRSIKTEMDSDFTLTQIGHYFQVSSVLRDYGNEPQEPSWLRARWDVTIINASSLETYDYSCDHDIIVSIV